MVMEDAVKEADGDAMMQLCRIILLDFWTNKHPKYLIQATRLLAGITAGRYNMHNEIYEKISIYNDFYILFRCVWMVP